MCILGRQGRACVAELVSTSSLVTGVAPPGRLNTRTGPGRTWPRHHVQPGKLASGKWRNGQNKMSYNSTPPHHNSFLSSALPAWPGRGGVMLMTRCGPVSQDVTRRDETSQRTNSHKMTQYQLSPATRHSHQDQFKLQSMSMSA